MNKDALRRLEYDKIIEMLSSCVSSEATKPLIQAMQPQNDYHTVHRLLQETSEAKNLFRLDPSFSFGGWKDISHSINKASKNAMLDGGELLSIAETLGTSRRVRRFFVEKADNYPLLRGKAEAIFPLPDLEKDINNCVIPGGEVADQASVELARLRRQIEQCRHRIRSQLDQIIRSPEYQKYLQESLVTIRNNRYVVPVKQEYRSLMPGLIHDQSASGATLFIEPMAVVESNNELKKASLAEKNEVEKILQRLSDRVEENSSIIRLNLQALTQIDFILARARLSDQMKAVEPHLNQNRCLLFKSARHPLLSNDIVPIDLALGQSFYIMVITGPNTGGKTVALKTAGLLQLMVQSGLHIPVRDESEATVFADIYADIGDEQSIEQSLSTFSSHMQNIVAILRNADSNSFVLLDELGAGTDPTEGAALAMAILEELYDRGTSVIATTHYSELKNFAYSHEQVENASVEFDISTLRPTYQLLIGKPGRSNAFEISERLGLSPIVTARARSFMTEEQLNISDMMNTLDLRQQQLDREKREVEELHNHLRELEDQYNLRSTLMENKNAELLNKAQEQAWQLVRDARSEARALLDELKEKIKLADSAELHRAADEMKRKTNQLTAKYQRDLFGDNTDRSGQAPKTVQKGQEVYLPKLNQKAIIINGPNEQRTVQVQAGIIKMSIPLDDIRLIEQSSRKPSNKAVSKLQDRNISMEVDLRGMNSEEAIMTLDKYIDSALLGNISRFTVIHGIGTGVLRSAVQNYLKNNKNVKSYRLGVHGEGSIGVTIVELK